ncbi:MAG TPA: ATP-grasp domain-containing protein [Chthoniobacterales bacterium]
MEKIRVLVFPCGAENALELHDALAYAVNVEVWGASSREDHGWFVFKNYIGALPFIQAPQFLSIFNQLIAERSVDVVFPTHDSVALYLAERRAELACRVITADAATAKICREKRLTYELFSDCRFVPRLYPAFRDVKTFPVFLKPNVGEGGKNAHLVEAPNEAVDALFPANDLLVMEYLPGEELTVDCFTDRYGKLRFSGARERSRVHCGISVNSKSRPLTPEIREIAEEINRRLRMRGLWFFQVKKGVDQRFKLMEISARAAGTMSLYRHRGVNLPLLSVYDAMDVDVEVLDNGFDIEVDRALVNRFKIGIEYDRIYLDLDDTLVCRGQVQSTVLLLLYQANREGKPVCLLTRHAGEVSQTLKDLRIDAGFFAEIRALGWDEEKYKAIDAKGKPIFIDNAFSERKKVRQNLGIPVFDVDAVGCLLDWRS